MVKSVNSHSMHDCLPQCVEHTGSIPHRHAPCIARGPLPVLVQSPDMKITVKRCMLTGETFNPPERRGSIDQLRVIESGDPSHHKTCQPCTGNLASGNKIGSLIGNAVKVLDHVGHASSMGVKVTIVI